MKMLLLLSILCAACTKEPKWTKDKLYSRSLQVDPGTQLVLPSKMNEGVTCEEYSEGCMSAHIVRIKGLELIAVEFATTEQAKFAAQKFRGYYTRNWMLDDVTKEPVLERFVVEHLEAKKP
jgi:hypothetical protein